MSVRLNLVLVSLLSAIAMTIALPALGAAKRGIQVSLLKRANCMASALKSVPNIDQVALGASDEKSADTQERQWLKPFVEYRFADKDGLKATIRFVAHESGNGVYDFMTMLSGLSAEGSRPRDWGTVLVGDIWKAKCHEQVSVLYI
jgi:hypothetical protein